MKDFFSVFWSKEHEVQNDEEGHRDPLRAQVILDSMADDLFRSVDNKGIALTSLTDHLLYLVFYGWAESFTRSVAEKAETSAYNRLVWQHAWSNYPDRDKKKIVVYGVRKLKKLPNKNNAKPSGWETGISHLVALGPKERYSPLWESLPEEIKNNVRKKFLSGYQDQARLLTNIARGNTYGLIKNPRISRLFSIAEPSRLRLFKSLGQYITEQPLSEYGLGFNLPNCTLKKTLFAIASIRQIPIPDNWTYHYLFNRPRPPSNNHVEIRLYRAALGRALVFAATRSFYIWAFNELKQDVPQKANRLHNIEPYAIIQKIKELTWKQKDDIEALNQVDVHCKRSGTNVKLYRLLTEINSQDKLTEYAQACAWEARKGFVSGTSSAIKIGDEELFKHFSGNYAGSLRLQQVWHFGRDLTASLGSKND